MTTQLLLNENEYSKTIKTEKSFESVKLVFAEERVGRVIQGALPFIELKLIGSSGKFSFHANRLPNSNQFNCFDLLTIAKETFESRLLSFNELLICCNKGFYQDQFEIQINIEYF